MCVCVGGVHIEKSGKVHKSHKTLAKALNIMGVKPKTHRGTESTGQSLWPMLIFIIVFKTIRHVEL